MNILGQISLVFGLCFLGEIVAYILPVQFPASVIAMILLFVLLVTKKVKKDSLESITSFFTGNMALFFIPPTVAIIKSVALFKDYLWQFVFVCFITTILTFLATAYTVMFVMKLMKNKEGENDDGDI